MASLTRRLQMTEDNLDQTHEQLTSAIGKLDKLEKVADESER